MKTQSDIYSISQSIDKKSYFVFFLNIHAYTSIKFEIVPLSDSKSIKIIFENEISEQEKQKLIKILLKLGLPININSINLIEYEYPKREYYLHFQDPVTVNLKTSNISHAYFYKFS
ncbi:hypothetical protein ACTFIZ_005418 [Dictyostelium cf. discoideum]